MKEESESREYYNLSLANVIFHSLGILETSLSGLSTRKERSIRKSKSSSASANIVIDLTFQK
jgi:hypothetical protein